jgi:hypothetical protein
MMDKFVHTREEKKTRKLFIGCFFLFHLIVEESIVNALYGLRITEQLFKSYVFTRVLRLQSPLQRLLRGEI